MPCFTIFRLICFKRGNKIQYQNFKINQNDRFFTKTESAEKSITYFTTPV